MEQWTETQWQAAERRDPTKTYVEPVLSPFFRDPRVWWAGFCLLIALIPLAGLWSIWPALVSVTPH